MKTSSNFRVGLSSIMLNSLYLTTCSTIVQQYKTSKSTYTVLFKHNRPWVILGETAESSRIR